MSLQSGGRRYQGTNGFIFGLFCWIFVVSVTEATKCYKNDILGDRTGNVYYCEQEGESECCEEEEIFTCCEPQDTKTTREQLIMWGTVALVILVISGVCCFFWKDTFCNRDDVPLSQKCCSCCRRKNDDEKDLTSLSMSRENTSYVPGPWPRPGSKDVNYGTETPPPFKFKSPSYGKY